MGKSPENYGSNYLYSEDLIYNQRYNKVEWTINAIHEPDTLTTANKKRLDKWTIGFEDTPKLLVLCKTNLKIIHVIFGDPIGPQWIGRKVKLAVRVVDAFGAEVTAIRAIPPFGKIMSKGLITRIGREPDESFAPQAKPFAQTSPSAPAYEVSGNEITWRGQTVAVDDVAGVRDVLDRVLSGNREDGDIEYLERVGFERKK